MENSIENSESDNSFCCRICLDEGVRKDFIAPCNCCGSQKWVHRDCLDQWRSSNEDKAFSRCTECLTMFKLICITNESFWVKFKNKSRFVCYIFCDFVLAFLGMHFAIELFGLVIYGIDTCDKGFIMNSFRMNRDPVLFYFLAGTLLTFAVIGTVCLHRGCRELRRSEESSDVTVSATAGVVTAATAAQEVDIQNAVEDVSSTQNQQERKDGNSSNCCVCDCGGCGGGGGGDCSGAAGGCSGGEAAVYCVVFILAILAVIGMIKCIIIIINYLAKATRKHVHMLRKRSLAHKYMVQDLADGALSIQLSPLMYDTEDKCCSSEDRDLEGGMPHALYSHVSSTKNSVLQRDLIRQATANDRRFNVVSPAAVEDCNLQSLSTEQRAELEKLGLL